MAGFMEKIDSRFRRYVICACLAQEAADKETALASLQDCKFLLKRLPYATIEDVKAVYAFIQAHSWQEVKAL